MANQDSGILASIGAIQTLVENFPMGLLSSLNVTNYSSSLEFLVDALRTLGVNDKEIITFLLQDLIGVNDLDFTKVDDADARFKNNAFIQGLESAIKFLIAEILANIISCAVWPKIPENAITIGTDLPLSILDQTNLLNTCPTTQNGLKKYIVASGTTTSQLGESRDLNAVIWHTINMLSPTESNTWSGSGQPLCYIQNMGYNKVRLKVHENFSGKTLFEFNKKYLDSITIFSPKVIITNIIDELINGLPNIEVNFGLDEIYNEAVFEKMIDTVVTNDDMEIEDCYYTFSNEDWLRMIEETELRKYNAKKAGKGTNTATIIDKQSVMDLLDEAGNPDESKTLHNRIEKVTEAIYEAAKTNTVEYEAMTSEAETTRKWGFDYEVNSGWLYNILSTIIRPIVKSAMSPKVMALILVNYEIAGSLNLSELNPNSPISDVLDFVKQKMLGIFAALIKKIKDMIVQAVLDLFNKKIEPLIAKYTAAKLLEQLENYTDLLRQAMECIDLFGFPYLIGNGQRTDIENVNYADITPVKNNPNKTVC